MIKYELPKDWMLYDRREVFDALVEAKASVQSLTSLPFQRAWVVDLQRIQLKREVAGTSQIEGADFTESELEAALRDDASQEDLLTRSQRQAHAAVETYRWISKLPDERAIDPSLIKQVHSRIVTGCDDDHCPPGELRRKDQNVVFGAPKHRGCEGGNPCEEAFSSLVQAVQTVFEEHDNLIRALALHYHFAAMHPFLDGNGRTARALEALVLQRAGLRDTAFIAMSNYYYDEKKAYLGALSAVRASAHNLTAFLKFGLRGITIQCKRLSAEIRKNVAKALFKNMMYDLFNRLETTRKRVIKDRQLAILNILLEYDKIDWHLLIDKARPHYSKLKNFGKTIIRDMGDLHALGAISIVSVGENKWEIGVRLEWPQEITESRFFEVLKKLPRGKTFKFLS